MVTELDHDAIKTQMVAILQANATLYDATGAGAKIRQINVEHPDGSEGFDKVMPSIYIKNANPFERARKIGAKTRGSESQPPLVHEFRYDIVLGTDLKDSRTSINSLDDFQKLILQTLEADHRFKNGGAALVDDSEFETVRNFSDRLNGKPIQGRIITFLCRVVTA